MPQTLLLDVAYMLEASDPFVAGGIVTAKPNGAVWKGSELAANMAMVTLEVDFATAVGVGHNLLLWKVDDLVSPTCAVLINP
jgi:hypothetical protein